MERQIHGFNYELDVISRFNLIKEEKYTSAYGAFTKSGYPVSIKLEKRNTDIELGDYFRNERNLQSFFLIVGFWEREKNNIVEQKILFIPGEEWHYLFNTDLTPVFRDIIDNITNLKQDDKKWKESIKWARKEWKNTTNNLIRPRFKRDHKKQKRIQCAINNKDFYKYFCSRYEVQKDEVK